MIDKSNYELNIEYFYKNNKKFIYNLANRIKSINLTVPLEAEDLITFSFYRLLESENKLEYFGIFLKNKDFNVNDFFQKKIWNYMRSYCNLYKSKNHQILNTALYINDYEEKIKYKSENYHYEELFSFLTKKEFRVFYEIKVNKKRRNQLSKEMNISVYKLHQIEKSAKLKICQHFNINI